MNADDCEKQNPNAAPQPELVITGVSGFLTLGLLTGLVIGYVAPHGVWRLFGDTFQYHHAWQHFEYLLKYLTIGAMAGLLVGYVFDALVRDLRSRREMIFLWIWLLGIGIVAAILLLPAVQMAR